MFFLSWSQGKVNLPNKTLKHKLANKDYAKISCFDEKANYGVETGNK